MEPVTLLVMPQVNVNDETVLLVRWSVPQYAQVAAGDVVCEVETSKATSEVAVDHAGVLMQSAPVGSRVRIGDTIGAIGTTRDALTTFARDGSPPVQALAAAGVNATPKARALAKEHGLTIEAVATGVHGTVKEADVRRFLTERSSGEAEPVSRSQARAPDALLKYADSEGPLLPFEAGVAAALRRSVANLILATVDMDCRLAAAHTVINRSLAAGRMLSLLHLVISAVAPALPRFPRLMSVAYDQSLYRYRAVDVAFVVRHPDGRLWTPVIRGADRLGLERIAAESLAATMRLMRNRVTAGELDGACFTVSHVPVAGTTRVAALPNLGQSAILGVSAERMAVELRDGVPVAMPLVTLTLTYDHAICDGVYAAEFLAEVTATLERQPT